MTSAWGWGLFIGTIIESSWDTGDEATITLDLADLPPDAGGRTSVIDAFADGDFDVVVDEDTQVDFVTITLCGCETATETSSWGRVKARFTGHGD